MRIGLVPFEAGPALMRTIKEGKRTNPWSCGQGALARLAVDFGLGKALHVNAGLVFFSDRSVLDMGDPFAAHKLQYFRPRLPIISSGGPMVSA